MRFLAWFNSNADGADIYTCIYNTKVPPFFGLQPAAVSLRTSVQ